MKYIPGHSGRTVRVLSESDYRIEERGFTTTCWIWNKATGSQLGYGKLIFRGERTWAHIAMWIQTNGLVPNGLELDHLCRVPACIRPEHLEAVTHAENLRRGKGVRVTPEVHAEVFMLRATGLSHRKIAQQVGIGKTTVGYVLNRERWIHYPILLA